MKLSEAIMIGAKLRPQCFDYFYLVVGKEIHSCVMGAAFEGAGFYKPEELAMPCHLDDKAYLFDGLQGWSENGDRFACPESDEFDECADQPIPALAAHLNDHHGWAREKIADHIEALGY